ncbi:YciI family protein [Streptomyces sp. NPDC097619]|uniref:YciI family protein n=1 Tax=Streptomyces sp. NPDC097619 TaxID=3157228 RepID=UPI00332D54FF
MTPSPTSPGSPSPADPAPAPVAPTSPAYFCYHRDRPGSLPLRRALLEEHWSYMDQYEKELIARGPTFAADGTPSGSVHIASLPDAAAARAFAFEEPGQQAGVYRDVLLHRWRDLLGRTMWEFPGGLTGEDRYLVLGLAPAVGPSAIPDGPPPALREDLLAYGPLLSDDATAWLGTVALVRAPDAAAAGRVLPVERYAAVEIHPWECGGRR